MTRGPALNVAGPRDGDLATWARLLASPLAAGLMQGNRLDLRYGGGASMGVTGVNQFDARAAPDGARGAALSRQRGCWLAPRRSAGALRLRACVAFDGGNRARRSDGARRPARARRARRVVAPGGRSRSGRLARGVAGAGPAGHLRHPGRTGEQCRRHLPTRPASRRARAWPGGRRLCAGPGHPHPTGRFRAGAFVFWPASRRRGCGTTPWLRHGGPWPVPRIYAPPWCCRRLSPAEAIGRWRHASRSALANPDVTEQARQHALQLVTGEQAADALAPMRLGPAAQIALHRWLSDKAGTQPG